jgi:hypothetical protein
VLGFTLTSGTSWILTDSWLTTSAS